MHGKHDMIIISVSLFRTNTDTQTDRERQGNHTLLKLEFNSF